MQRLVLMETVPDILARSVASFGERTALHHHGRPDEQAYSYQHVGWTSAALAQRLRARGAEKGTPIALLSENCPEWAIAYLAIQLAGAVCVPVDTQLTPGEISEILKRSRAKNVIASRALLPKCSQATDGLAAVSILPLDELLPDCRQTGADLADGLDHDVVGPDSEE